jgi:hypothetical protein
LKRYETILKEKQWFIFCRYMIWNLFIRSKKFILIIKVLKISLFPHVDESRS